MSRFQTARFTLPLVATSLALLAGLLVFDSHAETPGDTAPTTEQDVRFAKLEAALTGVTLVGHSTTTGAAEINLKPDRYELASVKHVDENRWLFQARITYGENDVTVPLTLPINWAGDTPVITVDNMGIPGLGTYTARVMIYANHYAGFWSAGDHGGHLFGVIERGKPTDETPKGE